jgi:hypothetical protein
MASHDGLLVQHARVRDAANVSVLKGRLKGRLTRTTVRVPGPLETDRSALNGASSCIRFGRGAGSGLGLGSDFDTDQSDGLLL